MNHAELTRAIAKETGNTQACIKNVLDKLQEILKTQLNDTQKFELKDIGTFKIMETAARTGRNPSNGEVIEIPAGTRIKFKASKALKCS